MRQSIALFQEIGFPILAVYCPTAGKYLGNIGSTASWAFGIGAGV
jgi:hypothetical protein